MPASQVFNAVHTLIQRIEETQLDAIQSAAELTARTVIAGGIVHLFGCGHSGLVADELFFRTGELAPINVIYEPSLMHHEGAFKSIALERLEGYASILLDSYELRRGEVIFVISNSGINAIPVEIALGARDRGLSVVAVTSVDHSRAEESRQSNRKRLFEIADIVLDNCVVHGDASLEIEGLNQRVIPLSSISAMMIVHAVMLEAMEHLLRQGFSPPVWISSNTVGGDRHNRKLLEKYRNRLVHL